MRTVALLTIGLLIAGFAVGLVLFLIENRVEIRVEIRRTPADRVPATVVSPGARQSSDNVAKSSPPPSVHIGGQGSSAPSDAPHPIIDKANRLAAGGQLREAQELYLQVLLVDPDDQEALRGLVRVRRLMAGENPVVLREQAEGYRLAISQGVDTAEHYTASAMDLLATASLLAATELEGSRAKKRASVTRPPTTARPPTPPSELRATASRPQARSQPKPKPAPSKRQATSKPKPEARPSAAAPAPARPAPAQRAPLPAAQATPPPEPPLNVNEPFVIVTVGPVASGERASTITTELTVSGYVARMRRGAVTGEYIITLGPYRLSVAEKIAALIRSRFGNIPVVLGPSS